VSTDQISNLRNAVPKATHSTIMAPRPARLPLLVTVQAPAVQIPQRFTPAKRL
jgi:hypothetical protein